jgi:hypothetical protein
LIAIILIWVALIALAILVFGSLIKVTEEGLDGFFEAFVIIGTLIALVVMGLILFGGGVTVS